MCIGVRNVPDTIQCNHWLSLVPGTRKSHNALTVLIYRKLKLDKSMFECNQSMPLVILHSVRSVQYA